MNKTALFLLIIIMILSSCATSNLKKYYFSNQTALTKLEHAYKEEYIRKPFSIEYSDRYFDNISIEIITDSLKLIYGFNRHEKQLNDTLVKYGLNSLRIDSILNQMESIGCIWLNKLDYYVDTKKNLLVFMSIRQKSFHIPLTKRKYYIISFFDQPQYFDEKGNLLNKRRLKVYRKIHGDIFKRITNKVAYTISDRFR